MEASVTSQSYADVFIKRLSNGAETAYLAGPCVDAVRDLVDVHDFVSPQVHVLASERAINRAMDDFMVAALAAECVDSGQLSFRVADLDVNNVLVTPQSTTSLVEIDTGVSGPTTDPTALYGQSFDEIDAAWGDSDHYDLPAPPVSTVRRTLESALSQAAARNFWTFLETVDAVPTRGNYGVSAVELAILASAAEGHLLNDVCSWADSVGLASHAACSRKKRKLEAAGIIVSDEECSGGQGAPAQRLHLTESFQEIPTYELAERAQDALDD